MVVVVVVVVPPSHVARTSWLEFGGRLWGVRSLLQAPQISCVIDRRWQHCLAPRMGLLTPGTGVNITISGMLLEPIFRKWKRSGARRKMSAVRVIARVQ